MWIYYIRMKQRGSKSSCWVQVACCWLLGAGCWLNPLPTSYVFFLPTANCHLSFPSYYLLLTTYFLLITNYFFLTPPDTSPLTPHSSSFSVPSVSPQCPLCMFLILTTLATTNPSSCGLRSKKLCALRTNLSALCG